MAAVWASSVVGRCLLREVPGAVGVAVGGGEIVEEDGGERRDELIEARRVCHPVERRKAVERTRDAVRVRGGVRVEG
jgi:hypothetical protein